VDDDTYLDPKFALAHPEVEGLPISHLLMQRLDKLADTEGNVSADDVWIPIVAAVVALERMMREG